MRAKAHHLDPVVMIGQHGLTPAVQHEIDLALTAHELIKIRVQNESRVERQAILEAVCAALDCAPVQHLGKLLVVWRANPAKAKAAKRDARPTEGNARPRDTRAAVAKPSAQEVAAERRKRRNAQGGKAGDATLPYFSRRGAGRFVANTVASADSPAPAPRPPAKPSARKSRSPMSRSPAVPQSRPPANVTSRKSPSPPPRAPTVSTTGSSRSVAGGSRKPPAAGSRRRRG